MFDQYHVPRLFPISIFCLVGDILKEKGPTILYIFLYGNSEIFLFIYYNYVKKENRFTALLLLYQEKKMVRGRSSGTVQYGVGEGGSEYETDMT